MKIVIELKNCNVCKQYHTSLQRIGWDIIHQLETTSLTISSNREHIRSIKLEK